MGETLIRVTDLTFEDENDLVVKMVGRAADGRRIVKDVYGTEPYLFVPEAAPPPESFEDCEDIIQDVRGGFQSYDGVPLVQVVVRYPSDVRTVRDHYASPPKTSTSRSVPGYVTSTSRRRLPSSSTMTSPRMLRTRFRP